MPEKQPRPTTGENSQAVSGSLKERFARFVDERTEIGVARYGQPLYTNDGRDTDQDMIEELLDFSQYQEKSRLELIEDNSRLRSKLATIRAYNWDLEQYT